MKIYRFDSEVSRHITQFGSDFAMARIIQVVGPDARDRAIQVGCMHIPAGGGVGFHQATTRQLFLVVVGEG